MTIKAKSILKDKFWIIENNKQKLGTLCLDEDRYMFTDGSETCYFRTKKEIDKKFGIKISWNDGHTTDVAKTQNELLVHGYPTSVYPYNTMYDVKRRLPLFTKSDKSKSLYCAGYYIINFDKGWVKSFCPKLITVERYETKGPFKTELEMRQELSRVS